MPTLLYIMIYFNFIIGCNRSRVSCVLVLLQLQLQVLVGYWCRLAFQVNCNKHWDTDIELNALIALLELNENIDTTLYSVGLVAKTKKD